MKNRKSPRKKGYDYSSPGAYFVTINAKIRRPYFGYIIKPYDLKLPQYMRLNNLGHGCKKQIEGINTRKNVHIHEYIIMPDHIHMIVVLGEWDADNNIGYEPTRKDDLVGRPDEIQTNRISKRTGHESVPTKSNIIIRHDDYQGPPLGQIINVFKGNVTKYAKQHQHPFARQGRYHDRIIIDNEGYNAVTWYIRNNPKKWAKAVSRC